MNKKFFYITILLLAFFSIYWMVEDEKAYGPPESLAQGFKKGMDLINQNRFDEAIDILVPIAEKGYYEAYYWIGFSYRYISLPLGSPKDEWRWYKNRARAYFVGNLTKK